MKARRLAFALRPCLPADVPRLADIFRAAVMELTEEDYGEEQREAWASMVDDEAAFAARLARQLTLIATLEGEPVGFASLAGTHEIDLLYVDPDLARHGAATVLCDALEKLAAARGAPHLSVDASDTARPFFEARGFVPEQRNSYAIAGEWLANTTMKKILAPNLAPDAPKDAI
jgi:putative acetyltransferase